jgi:2-polyprenyl-3-methyl-5-hydroxy-6-metoxy-1,4-benzoquinol methylase
VNSDAWNEKYRAADLLWSVTPNQFVERELAELAPGRALDLAAGEGRNAIWLAERGWLVTAIDFAEVAIERGRSKARERAVDVHWVVTDLLEFVPEPGRFDLVLIAYLQLPWPAMKEVLARAAAAVAPAGTFFLIAHDIENLSRGYGGPRSSGVLYSPAMITSALANLRVLRAETVERPVDTAEGRKLALDVLVRAARE